MKADAKPDGVLNRLTMRDCLGAVVVAGAAAFTPLEAAADTVTDLNLVMEPYLDPVFIGYPFNGEENFQMKVNSKTFYDYGGGNITGLQMHAIDPALTGGSYHTGKFTSQFAPITFNNGLGAIKFVGHSNFVWIDANNGNPLMDNSHFATRPDQHIGVAIGNRFEDHSQIRYGALLTGQYARNRTDLKGDARDDAGCDEENLDRDFCVTNANVYATTAWGKFTAGRVESASFGVGAINTGGIAHVTNNDPINKVGFHEVFGLAIPFSELAPDITGPTSTDGVRYDSPTIAGFTLSSSWGEDDQYDAALRYAGEFGAIRVAAGASFQNFERDGFDATQQNTNVAVSLYHTPTGLFITGSSSFVTRDGDAPPAMGETSSATSYYVQGGIRTQLTDWGDTVFFAEFSTSNNSANSGAHFLEDSGTENFGLGVVQDVDESAMSLYLTYNRLSADRAGIQGEDIDVVMGGVRLKY